MINKKNLENSVSEDSFQLELARRRDHQEMHNYFAQQTHLDKVARVVTVGGVIAGIGIMYGPQIYESIKSLF